jgi:hypothetical protein
MAKTSTPGRTSVTSDPDRGVAVNSGTDPQRPRIPARPAPDVTPDASDETSSVAQDVKPAARPSSSRNEDVEHGGRNEPDDPV